MIVHYIHSAVRNIIAHKAQSALTILGLTISFACAMMVAIFLRYELSYDRWINGVDQIYRLEITLLLPDAAPLEASTSPFPLGSAISSRVPGVTAAAHVIPQEGTIIVGDRKFAERAYFVTPAFFKMLQLPAVAGDASVALATPDSVVVTERLGSKLFPGSSPVGRTFTLDGRHNLRVGAVLRDLPENTHLVGDLFIPETSPAYRDREPAQEDWMTFRGWTYLNVAAGSDIDSLEAAIRRIYAERVGPRLLAAYRTPADRLIRIDLIPVQDIHLAGSKRDGMKPGGSWATVRAFSVVAVLIVLMACFNFVNLATARSTLRAREVGVRQVLGARRSQIMTQFLAEAIVTALLAFLLAAAVVELLLASGVAGAMFGHAGPASLALLLTLAALALATGAVAGFYPAVVVSRFRPGVVLRSNNSTALGSGRIRNALIILQFAISIGLSITALIIFAQVQHVRDAPLGFDSHNLVVLEAGAERPLSDQTAEGLARLLAGNPDIAGVARSDTVPFGADESRSSAEMPGLAQPITVRTINVSPEYHSVYRTRLLAGRYLSSDRSDDRVNAAGAQEGLSSGRNVLVDENAARAFGLSPTDAIGKRFGIGPVKDLTIVGVTANAVLQLEEAGSVFYSNDQGLLQLSVRLKPGRVREGLGVIDRAWATFSPDHAQRRYFVDDRYRSLFDASAREGRIFAIFVGVAMFIACFGMFGLSAFEVARRTREIGLRKVFGARTRDIVRLLIWQATKPIIAASLLAWPVAAFYLHMWMAPFSDRVSLSPLYFLAASTGALILSWITIAAHALRVACASPVHSLRQE